MKASLPTLPVTRAPLLVYQFQGWRWWCKECREISKYGYFTPGEASYSARFHYDTEHEGKS